MFRIKANLLIIKSIEPFQGSESIDYQPTVNSIYGYLSDNNLIK